MMITKMFPKKLPSRIKQRAESLQILSAFDSAKIHVQFCCPSVVSLPVTKFVVLFLNDMISSFAFQPRTLGASVLDQKQKVQCILPLSQFNRKWIQVILPVQCYQSKKDWIRQTIHLVYNPKVKVRRDNMPVCCIRALNNTITVGETIFFLCTLANK